MTGRQDDPVWEQALDWFMQVEARPDDARLCAARDAWMAEDVAHAEAYRKAERVWRLSGDARPAHARRADFETRPAPARSIHRRLVPVALALTACLLLVFLPALQVRLKADYRTAAAETRLVSLADGSMVQLDGDSAIAIADAPGRRGVVLLAGRAHFQVAPDAARPFSVVAGETTVTVVGTAFDIVFSGQKFSVAVQSGKVRVEGPGGEPLTLGSGDALLRDQSTGAIAQRKIPPDQVSSWRGGRLIVDGATVTEVVDELLRHSSGAILLQGDLGRRRVTGVYDLNDPASALRALVRPYGGWVVEVTPYLLIVSGNG